MGTKPIQDVAPPKVPDTPAPESPSGPELVSDIPVRAPANPAPLLGSQNSSYIVSEDKQPDENQNPSLPPVADKKDTKSPNTAAKAKPTAAIFFALLAVIFLAVGAYLQFLA